MISHIFFYFTEKYVLKYIKKKVKLLQNNLCDCMLCILLKDMERSHDIIFPGNLDLTSAYYGFEFDQFRKHLI